jgi:hypothetical protein
VEIFNPALWARDGVEVLTETVDRYLRHVATEDREATEGGERR